MCNFHQSVTEGGEFFVLVTMVTAFPRLHLGNDRLHGNSDTETRFLDSSLCSNKDFDKYLKNYVNINKPPY